MQSVLAYGVPLLREPTDDAWRATKRHVTDMFATFGKTKAMDFETELRDVPFESNSAAGFAFGGLKGLVGGDTHMRAVSQANKLVRDLFEDKETIQGALENSVPDIAFTRTQLTYLPEKLKVRNVWGEHFTYILLEGLFASPIMHYFVENETFFHIGADPRVSVTDLLRSLQRDHNTDFFYSFDWSQFDATAQRWEIEFAFQLVENMLEFPNQITRLAFNFTKELFMTRKIAAPDGNIYVKIHGVPSGSYYTILMDSIINLVRILYMFKRFTGKFPYRVYTQGDDSLVATEKGQRIDLHYSEHEVKRFYWKLNSAKCAQGQSVNEVEFLSRTIFGSDTYRDPLKLERLALYPEYPVTSGQISLYRVQSILDESSVRSNALTLVHEALLDEYIRPASEEDVPRALRGYKFVIRETKL